MTEWYKNSKQDSEMAMDSLHLANRARHELELRLHAELEAAYRLKQTVEEKVRLIADYDVKVDYFDQQRRQDLIQVSELQTKLDNSIRNAQLRERELQDQLDSLNDQIEEERVDREQWIKKFEGEQRQVSNSSTNILGMKTRMQDMELEIGNLESKVKTQVEQLDLQTESLSHAHSVATEKQLRIETLVQELAMQRQTGETIIA